MLGNQIIAAIRTGASVLGPAIITALVTWLTSLGVDITVDTSWGVVLAGLIFAVAVGVYNFAVNALSTKYPVLGNLLIVNRPPEYDKGDQGEGHINEGVDVDPGAGLDYH